MADCNRTIAFVSWQTPSSRSGPQGLHAHQALDPVQAAICVSARGLHADRRRGHSSHTNEINNLNSRVRRPRGQSSISIHTCNLDAQ